MNLCKNRKGTALVIKIISGVRKLIVSKPYVLAVTPSLRHSVPNRSLAYQSQPSKPRSDETCQSRVSILVAVLEYGYRNDCT
jgi:hypothetical protein